MKFTYVKPPLSVIEKDLIENIPPTCIILSAPASTNEDQASLALTKTLHLLQKTQNL